MAGRICFFDVESRSPVDLKETGADVYWRCVDTDVHCVCYAFSDDRRVRLWLPGQPCPQEIHDHAAAGGTFSAHNASFERLAIWHCLHPRHGWPLIPLEQFHCTAAEAAAMAVPRSLDGAAQALRLPSGKDKSGYGVMLRMARPRRVLEDGTLVWWDDPDKLQQLYSYCEQDVRVEVAVYDRLRRLSPLEQKTWALNERVNERGIAVDLDLVEKAMVLAAEAQRRLDAQLKRLTARRVEKFSQNARLIEWLRMQGVDAESVDKKSMRHLLAGVKGDLTDTVREVLELRQVAAKTSTAKLAAMKAWACPDGRVRGTMMYHGAGTGRVAHRGPQPGNLPRPTLSQAFIDAAIADIKAGCDIGWIELMYGPAMTVLADCIRGCLVAGPGKRLVMADFANIEGRVLAWLAGEQWKLDAFRAYDRGTGPDLYKVAASGIYGVDVRNVDKLQRQVGKTAELACGFAGGVGAFQKMAENYNVVVSDEQAEEIKQAWRRKHPAIVQFWYDLESAALDAVRFPGRTVEAGPYIRYRMVDGVLWCRLPAGRVLAYQDPRIEDVTTPWGDIRQSVTAMASKGTAWFRRNLYSGLYAENNTQGCARDFMTEAMLRLEAAGYPVVLTVHDEVVAEVPDGWGSVEEFVALMTELPRWAEGCPVTAEGDSARAYRK